MPMPIHMEIDEGAVKGSVEIEGREGTVLISELAHEMHIPTDVHSGKLTGVRLHQPFVVRAAVDAATPYLYQACAEGQTFKTVKLHFYDIDFTGAEVEYFTILLEDVHVASVRLYMDNAKNPVYEQFPHMIEYSFVYRRATWTFTDGALEFTDDWIAAR